MKIPSIFAKKETTETKSKREELYKSALEMILSLCKNYIRNLTEIQRICEIVLEEGKEDE